jgi:HSP20 family protein
MEILNVTYGFTYRQNISGESNRLSLYFVKMAKHFFLCTAVGWGDGVWQPPADIYQMDSEWILRLELAGVSPDDLEVTAEGRYLTVTGVRKDSLISNRCNFHNMEISFSRFRRTIALPFDLRTAKIRTEYQYGMLLIRILPEVEHE